MTESLLELHLSDPRATDALGAALARALGGAGSGGGDLGNAGVSGAGVSGAGVSGADLGSVDVGGGDVSDAGSSGADVGGGDLSNAGSSGMDVGSAGGGGSAVIYLHGELGAGKTTCVRSLLRTLGVRGLIRSPTYTLVETYWLPGVTCVHADLYRLQTEREVDELGLGEYFDGDCLLLVEWPEKGGAALPRADLKVTLTYRGDARLCRVSAATTRGLGVLGNLVQDSSLAPYVPNLT